MNFKDACSEHTLYIKFINPRDTLIVCIYVDDLIFTSSNLKMVARFRKAMTRHFEMINLGLMCYFVGIMLVIF